MLMIWTFKHRQGSELMTVCLLIIEDCGMKPSNWKKKKIFSYYTVNGTARLRLQEKGPYSIITHVDDLKEFVPDEDFFNVFIRLYSFVRAHIINIYLDTCVHI